MTGKKISELTDALSALGEDKIPIVRDDANYFISVNYIKENVIQEIASTTNGLPKFEGDGLLLSEESNIRPINALETREFLGLIPNVDVLKFDSKLHHLASYAEEGIVVNMNDTIVVRSIEAEGDISVENPNGIDGNPTISLSPNVSRLNQDEVRSGNIDMQYHQLTSPIVSSYSELLTSLNVSQNYTTLSLAEGNVKLLVLNSSTNIEFALPSIDRQIAWNLSVVVKQDAIGGRQVIWPNNVKWTNGVKPFVSAIPNSVDIFSFISVDQGEVWYGFVSGVNFL